MVSGHYEELLGRDGPLAIGVGSPCATAEPRPWCKRRFAPFALVASAAAGTCPSCDLSLRRCECKRRRPAPGGGECLDETFRPKRARGCNSRNSQFPADRHGG